MFHVKRSLDCSFATALIIGAIFHVNVTKLVSVGEHLPFFSEILNTDSDIWKWYKNTRSLYLQIRLWITYLLHGVESFLRS